MMVTSVRTRCARVVRRGANTNVRIPAKTRCVSVTHFAAVVVDVVFFVVLDFRRAPAEILTPSLMHTLHKRS